MIQKVDTSVTVAFTDSPRKLLYNGREHKISKLGYHHVFREGRTLFHVFSVASDAMFFRLVLNTETLKWRLTEIADGEVL